MRTSMIAAAHRLAVPLSLLAAALAACDKPTPAAKDDDKSVAEPAEPAQPDSDPAAQVDASTTKATAPTDPSPSDPSAASPGEPDPATAPASVEGLAYVLVNGRGVARLDASGWSLAVASDRRFQGMFAGADGRVYVHDFDAIKRLDGDALVDVAALDIASFVGALRLVQGKDGRLHGVSRDKYGVFADGKWSYTEARAIHSDLSGLTGFALAGDGGVWVSGSKHELLRQTGETWTALDLGGMGEHFYFSHLSESPTGEVYLTDATKLYRVGADALEPIRYQAEGLPALGFALAYNHQGQVLSAAMSCELVRVDPRSPDAQWTVGKGGYGCATLQTVALDDQDRAWVGSREGLSVIAADKRATEYPSGSVLELVGDPIVAIVVLGDGPALPPAGPVRTASVTGKIVVAPASQDPNAGAEAPKALALAKLELCPTPTHSGGQPCAGAKVRFAATTDDDGQFRFDEVPLGSYGLAVELDGKWRTQTITKLTRAEPGSTQELGEVLFNPL